MDRSSGRILRLLEEEFPKERKTFLEKQPPTYADRLNSAAAKRASVQEEKRAREAEREEKVKIRLHRIAVKESKNQARCDKEAAERERRTKAVIKQRETKDKERMVQMSISLQERIFVRQSVAPKGLTEKQRGILEQKRLLFEDERKWRNELEYRVQLQRYYRWGALE